MTTPHHNLTPAQKYLHGVELEGQGVATKLEGIALRAEAYAGLYAKAQSQGQDKTTKLNNFLRRELEQAAQGSRLETSMLQVERQDRSALLWFHENPEQVRMVRIEKPDVLNVRGMQQAWNAIRKRTIKEEIAEGATPGQIADALFEKKAVVEEIIVKEAEAEKRKAEKEKTQPIIPADAFAVLPGVVAEELASVTDSDAKVQMLMARATYLRSLADYFAEQANAILDGEEPPDEGPALVDLDPEPAPKRRGRPRKVAV